MPILGFLYHSNGFSSVYNTNCFFLVPTVSKPTKTSPGKTYRKNDKVLHKVGSRAPKSLYNMAGNRRKSCADMNSLESKEDSESADQLGNLLASEEYRTGNGESTSLHDEVKVSPGEEIFTINRLSGTCRSNLTCLFNILM